MIVWGSGGDVIDCGQIATQHCEVCDKERRFKLVLEYRHWGVYWVFNFVTEKKWLMLCDICGRGWELDTHKVESELDGSPIPFMKRFGCLTFIGVVVFIWILSAISGSC